MEHTESDTIYKGVPKPCEYCAGEMMVGPKKTLFMDEISTGLDSSTTFQIVKCMRDFVHLREGTVLMSLLQPAPEVYNLFDDILLLSEGIASAVSGCILSLCLTNVVQCRHQRHVWYVQTEGTWLFHLDSA